MFGGRFFDWFMPNSNCTAAANMGFTLRPLAHLRTLATFAGLGTIFVSSDSLASLTVASAMLPVGRPSVDGEIDVIHKGRMVDIITQQSEDSCYDEILRELAYARMVQRGLADSDAGRTLSSSEVRQRIESWQK